MAWDRDHTARSQRSRSFKLGTPDEEYEYDAPLRVATKFYLLTLIAPKRVARVCRINEMKIQTAVGNAQEVLGAIMKSLATLPPDAEVKFWFGTKEEYYGLPYHDPKTYYVFTGGLSA